MAQPIWPWAQKQGKKGIFCFLGCFWAYVGQPHGHIHWATSMPFASINPTNPSRTQALDYNLQLQTFQQVIMAQLRHLNQSLDKFRRQIYSEVSNKHGVFLILFEKIFPTTGLIRTSTFINFWGILPPPRLLEPPRLFILGENPAYMTILSSFKHLFNCFKHFKITSKSQIEPEWSN